MPSFRLFAVEDLPLFQPGDDISTQIAEKLTAMGERLQTGDIVVIAQKIVSKAEGRVVPLAQVTPDDRSRTGRSPDRQRSTCRQGHPR